MTTTITTPLPVRALLAARVLRREATSHDTAGPAGRRTRRGVTRRAEHHQQAVLDTVSAQRLLLATR